MNPPRSPLRHWRCLFLALAVQAPTGAAVEVIPLTHEAVQTTPKPTRPDAELDDLAGRIETTLQRIKLTARLAALLPRNQTPTDSRSAGEPPTAKPHGAASTTAVAQPNEGTEPTGLEISMRGIGTPRLLRGALQAHGFRSPLALAERRALAFQGTDDEQTARRFFQGFRPYLRLDAPDRELKLHRREIDELGLHHLRFSQTANELPVWPTEMNLHFDAQGNLASLDGHFVPTPHKLPARPIVSELRALAAARQAVGDLDATWEVRSNRLIVYAPPERDARLAWQFELAGGLQQQWMTVIDAVNGRILAAFRTTEDAAAQGSGADLFGTNRSLNLWHDGNYFLVDTSKPMFNAAKSNPPQPRSTKGAIIVSDARNKPASADPQTFPQTFVVSSSTPNAGWLADGVSAAVNLSSTYDYYRARHGRNSIDGQGGNILGVVRLGLGFNNAFWASDLNTMFLGDAQPFAGALDVIAHELTHGVTAYSANLLYQNQPGALNEAFSDIFGEMVEAYAEGSNDWRIGSRLSAPIRDLKNPNSLLVGPGLPYPESMSQFIKTTRDNGGVHLNATIIGHAFYLLAEGLPGAIGLADAERIFYRALTIHLTQSAQFIDARLACLQSAEELFGAGSAQAQRVAQAFDAVEILDVTPGGRGTATQSAVNVADAAIFLYFDGFTGSFKLGRREPDVGDGERGIVLSQTPAAATRTSITADGSFAMYVSADHDVCFVSTDKPIISDGCLGVPGRVYSGAMSPDGNYFAFVLANPNNGAPSNQIVLIDRGANNQATRFNLVAPTTAGLDIASVEQADLMTFTANGRFLIYDALNQIRQDDGQLVGAWSIYAIDLATHQTLLLVPPVVGEDIASPAIGNLSDDHLVFEGQDQSSGVSTIYAARMSDGLTVAVARTSVLGFPTFTGDDGAVIFSDRDSNTATLRSLYIQRLRADRTGKRGSVETWLADATLGTAYRRGARYKLNVRLTGRADGRVIANPAGIDCGDVCSAMYTGRTRVRLTATPGFGAQFDGFSGSCSGRKSCVVAMNREQIVSARFSPLKFFPLTVTKTGRGSGTISSPAAGIDCGASCSGRFSFARQIELAAAPSADSSFAGWSGACRGKGRCKFEVTSARKVRARFDLRKVRLLARVSGPGSIVSSPAAIRCGSKCSAKLELHQTLSLTAKPRRGAVFAGWSGACQGTGACTVTLKNDTELGASFIRP